MKYFFYAAFWLLISTSAIAQNTNLGTNAGNSGTDNTALGYAAGDVVTGNANTFVGSQAGLRNTSGINNTFVGFASGFSTTTGFQNAFIGGSAGYYNTTGNNNVYVGEGSGKGNDIGSRNTLVGQGTGYVATGSDNSILGNLSGRYMTTGSQNIFIGSNAGLNNITGSGNIFVGYNAGVNEAGSSSNKLYIENSGATIPLIYGDFNSNQVGINALPATYTLNVGGSLNASSLFVNGVSVAGNISNWSLSGSNNLYSTNANNIGIGTTTPDAKLTVKGTIHAQEVKVDLSVPGPDYVFETTYQLPTLEALNAYIKVNKHLPEIPSAEFMKENGIELGEMNMLLLKKIEELTLYMIELKKENEEIKKQLQSNR